MLASFEQTLIKALMMNVHQAILTVLVSTSSRTSLHRFLVRRMVVDAGISLIGLYDFILSAFISFFLVSFCDEQLA